MSHAHGLIRPYGSARAEMSRFGRLATWLSAVAVSLALWAAIGFVAAKVVSVLTS